MWEDTKNATHYAMDEEIFTFVQIVKVLISV